MSESWYLMTTPNQMSGFENDYFTDYATDSFSELLTTFVGEDVTIYNSTMTTNTIVKGIVQSKYQKQNEMQILLPLNSCEIGMYVKYKNLYWLIIDFVNDNKMYQKAIIQICNYTLPFQHPQTGTTLSYPCVEESSNMAIGIDESDIINTLNGIKRIKLPFDDNTKLIDYDDRFFISKGGTTTYKVTNINNTEFNYGDKGLIVLTLKADSSYNPLTDKNGVCNYFEPTVEPEPPDPEVPTEIVTITSDDAIDNEIMLGIPHSFSATFKNELGEDVDNVIAEYSVDNTYDGKVVLTDNGDGTCTVQVGDFDDTELCTKQFTLSCMDIRHGFSSSVLLTIIGLF